MANSPYNVRNENTAEYQFTQDYIKKCYTRFIVMKGWILYHGVKALMSDTKYHYEYFILFSIRSNIREGT